MQIYCVLQHFVCGILRDIELMVMLLSSILCTNILYPSAFLGWHFMRHWADGYPVYKYIISFSIFLWHFKSNIELMVILLSSLLYTNILYISAFWG